MVTDENIHKKLDAIYADPEALSHFMQQIMTVAMQGLVYVKYQNKEITPEEYKEWSKKPPIKMLEEYGITYQQYRSLLAGKGTYATGVTFQRIMERHGFNYYKLFYSEKIIDMAYRYLKEREATGLTNLMSVTD